MELNIGHLSATQVVTSICNTFIYFFIIYKLVFLTKKKCLQSVNVTVKVSEN